MRAIDDSQNEVSVSAGAELPLPAASREKEEEKEEGWREESVEESGGADVIVSIPAHDSGDKC